MAQGTEHSSTQPEQSGGPKIGITAVFTIMIGIAVALGTGPVLQLLTRVLPTTEAVVEVTGRERLRSMQSGSGGGGGWSYWVTVKLEDGRELRLDSPQSLYDEGPPGLMSLYVVTLHRSVLLGVPVSVTLTSRLPPPQSRSHVLVMEMWETLLLLPFMLWMAGYLLWRLMTMPGRPLHWPILLGGRPLHWPILLGGTALSIYIGVMLWVPG